MIGTRFLFGCWQLPLVALFLKNPITGVVVVELSNQRTLPKKPKKGRLSRLFNWSEILATLLKRSGWSSTTATTPP